MWYRDRKETAGRMGNKVWRRTSKMWLFQSAVRQLRIIICFVVSFMMVSISVHAASKEESETVNPNSLYAKSAVLMDGSSGRILYEKNGKEFLANASTTKILTCILALEYGNSEEWVTVSSYAASMPDVQLNIREGEQYLLKDLLYSLMLESHNDSAVAIAEHIAGSCEEFSQMMNRKAKEIGCENTFFLTPNGLDASQTITDQGKEYIKEHGTTAADLALIMRYCILLSPKKDEFLKITSAPAYSFGDREGKRNFSCRNRNAFLQMMEGAISGKTGFTGKAGYCYVGALSRGERTYIVALLACGWPGNKNYKWADSRALMEYGLEQYEIFQLKELPLEWDEILSSTVENGVTDNIGGTAEVSLKKQDSEITRLLLKEGEKVTVQVRKKELKAPVKKGSKAGTICYLINGEMWMEEEVYCEADVEQIDFMWCLKKCMEKLGR